MFGDGGLGHVQLRRGGDRCPPDHEGHARRIAAVVLGRHGAVGRYDADARQREGVVARGMMQAQALGVAVNRAAKHVFGPVTCLTRSLVLRWWLLRRYGTTSDLCIGVRLEQGEFAAHAWVEKDGIPLNDRPEFVARYAIFESK